MEWPKKTRTSRTGSNLKARDALTAYEARMTAARLRPRIQARKKFLREKQAFLTKAVIRTAAEISRSNRHSFDIAYLKANGDGAAIAKARVKARRSIDRALRQQIEGYSEFRAKQLANAASYHALVEQERVAGLDAQMNLDQGAIATDSFDYDVFGPPFRWFAVEPLTFSGSSDDSRVDPMLGFVINDITFDDDHHSSLFGFSIYPPTTTRAAVGVSYKVPRTGRLKLSAVIQNLFNYTTFSITDNFGISDGELHIRFFLFARILRGESVIGFERLLDWTGFVALSSSDFTGLDHSGLNMATPYTLSTTTAETFLKGEVIQVLVGSSIEIESHMNDMHSHVRSQLAWHVKKLYLGIS